MKYFLLSKRKYLLLLIPLCVFIAGLTFFIVHSRAPKPFQPPTPISYQPKSGGVIASGGQLISAKQGGTFTANDVTVKLPPQFRSQDASVTYHALQTKQIKASNEVSPMFDLHARLKDGTEVHTFDKPLQIVTKVSDDALKHYHSKDLALWFFNTKTNQWEKLPSAYDSATHELIATTTHFTIFMVAGTNPNSGVTQPPPSSGPVIVDDQDPGFVYQNLGDSKQIAFLGTTGVGYQGNSSYTFNSVTNYPHNAGTWTATGITGAMNVSVDIPAFTTNGVGLTHGATYVITHAGGTSSVTIDQAANAGKTVSLGAYTFNGTGSVYLSDVVAESSTQKVLQSIIIYDAVSFGAIFSPALDLTPPLISNVIPQPDNGLFRIQAIVTDPDDPVASVVLFFNGQYYKMQKGSGNIYSVTVPYAANANLDYTIFATDSHGNESSWKKGRGYASRGSFGSYLGYYKGGHFSRQPLTHEKKPCSACGQATGQGVGDPIDTFNGNLIDEESLITLKGRPEIALNLTYNNQADRPSIFGENWSHSYNYHVTEMNTIDFQGAFIQYPDGHVVKFSGPNFQPDPGYYETLTRTGSGYQLTFTDLSKVTFDATGDITRWEDANGNGITFAYGTKNPYTLLSQITSMTADGGRSLQFSYNAQGLVQQMTSSDNRTVQFAYSDQDDLLAITDARTNTTHFEYIDHNLTKKISPQNYPYFVNAYDNQRRVLHQTAGVDFAEDITFTGHQTTMRDANGNVNTYSFTSDGLMTSEMNPVGKTQSYQYTPNREVKQLTDRDNNTTNYTYDNHGNITDEKDPLGFDIQRTFDPNFNKPLSEIYKQNDHTTQWQYDANGNLLKVTNALHAAENFTYDAHGELMQATDFDGHPNTYTYTPAGDVATFTDGASNAQTFTYDAAGHVVALKTPRQQTYNYQYDGNDNLLQVSGPLGYKVQYVYDPNNHVQKIIDANGGVTQNVYDQSENLISRTDPMSFVKKWTYGPMNELLTETNPNNEVTTYIYDGAYHVKSKTEATGTLQARTTQYTYNGSGDVLKVIDPLGRVTAYTYDPLHRQTKEVQNYLGSMPTYESDIATTMTYTPTGALQQIVDGDTNPTKYTFDSLDQILTRTDAENQVTTYTYDPQGNIASVKNPRQFTMQYIYDGNNRVSTMTDARNGKTTFTYDPDANLASVTDPNTITTQYTYNELDRRSSQIQHAVANGLSDAQTNVTTQYTYDGNGNLTALKNPRGFTTTLTYDPDNRNTAITDADTHTAHFTYDPVANLIKVTDRNNHSRNYIYDPLNRLVQTQDASQHTEKFAYDPVSNLIDYVNPRGFDFQKKFDPLNRLRTATDPYQKTKQYTYDAIGNLVSLTDENGHTRTYTYDKVYRQTKFTDAENIPTQYQYDGNGNLIKKIDGETNPTSYAYDELDRLIQKTDAENEIEKYSYDATQNLTSKTQADSTVDQFTYDPLYRLAKVVNTLKTGPATNDTNVTTQYTYDANGNLTKTDDPLHHDSTFAYDDLDRLQKEINPLNHQWTYGYDPEGNLTQRVDANNTTTVYAYNPDNTLQKITYPTHAVTYAYNENKLPTQMVDNLGTTAWTYDKLDRLISQNDPLQRSLGYEYDFVGNLKKLNYPDGRSVNDNYLKNDWLAQTMNSDNNSVNFTRNKVGLPTRLDRSNSSFSQINYDKVYRPLQVWDNQIGSGNHLISKFNYTYNPVGGITQEIAQYGWRQPSQVTTKYAYDGLHRLTNASADDGENNTYAYDAAGNRTTLAEKIKQGNGDVDLNTYSYDAANELLNDKVTSPHKPDVVNFAYQYDANGNRIDQLAQDTTGVDHGTHYSYDEENRLLVTQDYQGNLTGNGNTASISATPTPTPSPTPSASPSPSPNPCKNNPNSQGQNNVKGDGNCNNGNGVGPDQNATGSATVSPSPSPSPSPTATSSAAVNTGPTLQPETQINSLAHTTLAYDGNGRRLVSTYFSGASQQGKRTEYTFDRLDPIVENDIWDGTYKNLYRDAQQNLLLYQNFKSQQAPQGTQYWFHYDGRGNIAATTKSDAQSDHTYRYDEYGNILPETNGASNWTTPHNTYTLTQKQFDPNTGLYYFGARHYDPTTGTWMTQDPYRGQLPIPQTLHRYMYNLDGPVNYRDVYGYYTVDSQGHVTFQDHEYVDDLFIKEMEKTKTRVEQTSDDKLHSFAWEGRKGFDTIFWNGQDENGQPLPDVIVCLSIALPGCYKQSQINYAAQGMWAADLKEPLWFTKNVVIRAWKIKAYGEFSVSKNIFDWTEWGYKYYKGDVKLNDFSPSQNICVQPVLSNESSSRERPKIR